MFKRMKKFFGIHCTEDEYGIFDNAAEKLADYNELKHSYDSLLEKHRSLYQALDREREKYDALLGEYERVSRKYFALKLGKPDRFPDVRPEFAPKCVRKNEETWSYFRMSDSSRIPDFVRFLRNSGHWRGSEEPEVKPGVTRESLEPVVEFVNEKGRLVQIPCGCVFMTNDASPRIEWLVIPEETFEVEWLPI